MKSSRLLELLKKGNFVVPLYLFQLRDKFTLSLEEFMFLVYLMNLGERIVFNPEKLGADLNLSLEDVMTFSDDLSEKGLVSLDVVKNEKGIREEYIVLTRFYEKISKLLIDEINEEDPVVTKSIYEKIEEGFARPLTSIEYEIIKSWLESGVSEDLVSAALKETVFNGVTNLRYMDKILYDWTRKGYKTSDDVEKAKSRFIEEKKESKKLELFDYDWFDDEESEQS